MIYFFILTICLIVFVLTVLFMKKFTNTKITNLVFVSIILLCHIGFMIITYLTYGCENSNFIDGLPIANVSPFMFLSTIFYFVLPKKIKKYYLTLVSLLSLGMFLAPVILISIRLVTSYNFYFWFLLNYIPHFAISLWGIYLVKSKQVEFTPRKCFFSGLIIVVVAVLMFVLNIIFGTSFFGLSLSENYNIYSLVLVPNAYLSAVIYFTGLIVVLFAGYFFQKILNYKKTT